MFLSDPTKNRSAKAASSYWNAVEIAEAVQGRGKIIAGYDRQCARDIVAMLKWLPSNAKKRFPKLDYRQASEKGRTGRYPLLSAKSVNDYIIKLSTLLNFAINEGWVDRNPFRGLQLNDDVHPRDKRHPFSNDQLNRIFNAPLYAAPSLDFLGVRNLIALKYSMTGALIRGYLSGHSKHSISEKNAFRDGTLAFFSMTVN
ncbi:MAG: hypothetical protein ACTHLA_06825 [Asticcacaulis sp.]|uniref:hypothetical protein n=1 Tax=Asticcacaulis sp. TaxID=1872648 RepID=UPI003F7C59F3